MEGGSPSAPGALARVRVMLSRSVVAEPAPSAPLAGTSRLHRRAASTRCLRCAGAPRRPARGSGLSLPFRPDMPSSLTPGSSDIASVQLRDADTGLRRDPSGSALPTLPQSVPRGTRFSRLHWFAFATACQVARPPGRIGPGFPGPPGTFTSRLPAGRSPFPPLDMTTKATGLLCWRDFHPQERQLASLHRTSAESSLRTWGLKLKERIGFKRAAVAVARKLAVVMHAMLRFGQLFDRTAGVAA